MLNEHEKIKLLSEIQKDFPESSTEIHNYMLKILDHAFECSELLTGNRPTEAKAKAIVAQLKSFLQLLNME